MDPLVAWLIVLCYLTWGAVVEYALRPTRLKGLAVKPLRDLTRRLLRVTFWPLWAAYITWRNH